MSEGTGKVALVTGGGTGIGAATAVVLRERGWDVMICGRRAEQVQRLPVTPVRSRSEPM